MLEAQCQANLIQQTSFKEVVVWVNENGDPIDPNMSTQKHASIEAAPQTTVSGPR